tara:strand:- start:225 stop:851 length:627 start_codon:yes stop_codon:yes gene_type:complete
MNNFEVLYDIDDKKSLMIIDENKLAIDDRYFVSYREKYDINDIVKIIKGTIMGKICIKEMIYKNEDELLTVSNALNHVFGRVELMALNQIYNDDEKEIIVNMLRDLILIDKSMNKKIYELKEKITKNIDNDTICNNSNSESLSDRESDSDSHNEFDSQNKYRYPKVNRRNCKRVVNNIVRKVKYYSIRALAFVSSSYSRLITWLNGSI